PVRPPLDAVGALVDRPERVRSPGDIFQRQLHEERFARVAAPQLLANRGGGAAPDGLVEVRGIRRKPGPGQFIDVPLKRRAIQQVARDVVEPETLTKLVKSPCRFHQEHREGERGRAWFHAAGRPSRDVSKRRTVRRASTGPTYSWRPGCSQRGRNRPHAHTIAYL